MASPATAIGLASFRIRQNKQGGAGGRIQVQNGAFNASAATVRQLIVRAYGVQDFQIVDEPGWVNSDRFDMAARMQSGTAPNQLTLMLRSLLAERFALRSHTETRDLPVYALVLARKDKKMGPHIQPSKVDCDAIAEEAQSRGGAPPPMRPGEKPPCSIGFSARGQMSSRSKPISDLLTFFSQTTQRPVIDRTGLKGGWDIDLTWTPDAGAARAQIGIHESTPARARDRQYFAADGKLEQPLRHDSPAGCKRVTSTDADPLVLAPPVTARDK